MNRYSTLYIIIALLLLYSCQTSQKAVDTMEDIEERAVEQTNAEEAENQELFARYRSQLSDVYASQKHDYPKAFLHRKNEGSNDNTPDYRGFRIQLISTRNVSVVDSVRTHFYQWLKKNPTTYKPRAHRLFRQPYYRVHIGDFQDRERAIIYSRLLKKEFPGAWVVHDRINPKLVPSDTLEMEFAADSITVRHDTTTARTDTLSIELDESSTR
jgi:hypothetical protein